MKPQATSVMVARTESRIYILRSRDSNRSTVTIGIFCIEV
jgi:hypothetical protein